MRDESRCPWCFHTLDRTIHDPEVGCVVDWQYDEHGIATKDGCDCPLTLARDA